MKSMNYVLLKDDWSFELC